jgi:hypothetical protein
MARESREVWRKRVERWRASGLTAREFAAEIGVNGNTLQHWGWLLQQEEPRSRPAARRAAEDGSGFVEVVAAEAPRPPTVAQDAIEVVIRDRIRVRISGGFDADVLRRVVAALEVA